MTTTKTRTYKVAMWADGEKFHEGQVRATSVYEALDFAEKWAKTTNDMARDEDPSLPLISIVKVAGLPRVIN